MDKKVSLIESIDYYDEKLVFFWEEEVEKFFMSTSIEDISDFDVTNAFTCLVAIDNEGLFYEGKRKREKGPFHFLEITISGDKPLAFCLFLKYTSLEGDADLFVSEEPFLKDHIWFKDKFNFFCKKHDLLALDYLDLTKIVDYEEEAASIYYKYFDSSLDDRLSVSFKLGKV